MSDAPEVDQQTVDFESSMSVSGSVALALRHQRVAAGFAIRDLGRASGVSSAMISRIENAQVSPSLSTLESLARALSVPVISFFQHTIQTADMNFVRAGEGLQAKRFAPDHVHDYRILANFSDTEMTFSAARITVNREDNGTHPMYFARGYVFLTLLEGACIYACGDTENEMKRGDCLSFNAQLRHGVKSVLTKSVTFVTVTAKPA
ncbi:helix-turn-helix domain-containing protein [Ovoidimarina sediminis]|uniref:helix-turn-helix domain-containing protein n=1 Tax=Ovoidimarina sediminis TaxID=3079856 RepID=UPI00290AFCC3|nr:helix-turn-helix domain-containing protein [Rhodophyticola sp. MJ-SS7]MDU8944118.1 helix-turn-helix domain-containing protein [Rhodophyticola sp. MJ-SS7]